MVLAAFLFIRRMADVANVSAVTRELEDDENGDALDAGDVRLRKVPQGVEVFEINGPFFFGAAELFKDTLAQVEEKPKVLIIRMRYVPALDSTGLHALKDVAHRARRDGTEVFLSDVPEQPLAAMTGSPLLDEIGIDHVVDNIDVALERARRIVSPA